MVELVLCYGLVVGTLNADLTRQLLAVELYYDRNGARIEKKNRMKKWWGSKNESRRDGGGEDRKKVFEMVRTFNVNAWGTMAKNTISVYIGKKCLMYLNCIRTVSDMLYYKKVKHLFLELTKFNCLLLNINEEELKLMNFVIIFGFIFD